MKIYTDILLIAAIYVFLLDVSGGWQSLSSAIKGWMTHGAVRTPFSLRPFSCSLCMTFWTGLVYLLAVGAFTIGNVAYVCLVAWLTPVICDVLVTLQNLAEKLIDLINQRIKP